MIRYRPNVVLILEDSSGRILIGERSDRTGCWQFPQGGVKAGESQEAALHREAMEEIGLSPKSYTIMEKRGPYRYEFPPDRKREGFGGQEQMVFRAGINKGVRLNEGAIESPEFVNLRWIRPEDFRIEWAADFKQAVYRQVFREFWDLIL